MKAIRSQIEKEWSSFRRDRLGMSLAILLPLATLLLFGYGVRLQNSDIPICIEDRDRSSTSRNVIARLRECKELKLLEVASGNNIADQLLGNRAKATVFFPKGFSKQIVSERVSPFQVIVDGSDVGCAETVNALVQKAAFEADHQTKAIDTKTYFAIPEFKILFNPGVDETPYIVSGVFAIVLWMYPALLAAVAISRELEQKTIIQVYASGLTPSQFLVGKGTVYFLVGTAVAIAMAILGSLVFGLRTDVSWAPLFISTMIYIAAAVSFGLFVGATTREENIAVQATATGGFFPALLLSGFVYPLSNIPFPLSLVSYIVPARYYIDICRDIYLRAGGWDDAFWRMLIIAGFGLLPYLAAWVSIRHMTLEEKK